MENGLNNRMYFLDNLRAFIVLLVIIFHVAIGYMAPAPQWWYVIDTQHNPIFNLFVMDTDVFIMPIMFLIAGYFTVPVLQKKEISTFVREKFFRIVLPWIAGVFLFAPAITYMIWYSRTSTPPAYLSYLGTLFFTDVNFNHAHYWFLGDLAWFYLVSTIIYKVNPSMFQRKIEKSDPSIGFFLLFGLLTAVGFFIPNLFFHADAWLSKLYVISFQPSRFFLCLSYFALGIYGWKNQWFTERGYMPRFACWGSLGIIMMLVFTYYRITFMDTTPITLKAGHALVHSFFCLTAAFGLITFFQKYVNSKAYLWRRLSANSYTIYYIHQGIVLPIAYMMQKIELSVWVKYFSVSITCVIVCFLVSEYVITKTKSQLSSKQEVY
ncbi:acyltransferase family protein [Pelosinus sp. sgz500959]|uniref:acyltransferase family protein n=1 Tax=Pelosinus sp. sgz500959 TaxID=3242472 RepID=UPI0036734848